MMLMLLLSPDNQLAQALELLASSMWSPHLPEKVIIHLQSLPPTGSSATKPGSEASAAIPMGLLAGATLSQMIASAGQAAAADEKAFLQLCTALAVMRRTACFLTEVGIKAAYLYLVHMVESLPRCGGLAGFDIS